MSQSPYSPPSSSLTDDNAIKRQQSTRGRFVAVVGALCLGIFPLCLLIAGIELLLIYLQSGYSGPSFSQFFWSHFTVVYDTIFIGMIFWLPGTVLLFIAFGAFKFRRAWVYRASMIAATLALLYVPIGTILALPMFYLLIRRKKEFFV